jgi:hypothetical protein
MPRLPVVRRRRRSRDPGTRANVQGGNVIRDGSSPRRRAVAFRVRNMRASRRFLILSETQIGVLPKVTIGR